MKPLSETTVLEIVVALRQYRERDLAALSDFQSRARNGTVTDGLNECIQEIQTRLNANAAAAREISEQMAPYIKKIPAFKSVFEQAPQAPTAAQEKKL